MQPNQPEEGTSKQVTSTENIIALLHKVTPLSKYLTLALFIVLPFIGAFVGWQYAVHGVVVETETSLPVQFNTDIQNNQERPVLEPQVQSESFPQKPNTTIRYAVEADRDAMGAKNSVIPFDYFWTYKLLPDTIFATKEAYDATQLPYLTMLTTFNDVVIFTASCFVESECGNSGLYSYDAVSRTLRVLESGREYNEMYTGRFLSPDGKRLLLVTADKLRYVDLQSDIITNVATLDANESALFAICELGCQSNARWVDNQTVEVETYRYEICIGSQVDGFRQCGKKNPTGDVEWSEPIAVEVRQYNIE
jgi:hypothetical protein